MSNETVDSIVLTARHDYVPRPPQDALVFERARATRTTLLSMIAAGAAQIRPLYRAYGCSSIRHFRLSEWQYHRTMLQLAQNVYERGWALLRTLWCAHFCQVPVLLQYRRPWRRACVLHVAEPVRAGLLCVGPRAELALQSIEPGRAMHGVVISRVCRILSLDRSVVYWADPDFVEPRLNLRGRAGDFRLYDGEYWIRSHSSRKVFDNMARRHYLPLLDRTEPLIRRTSNFLDPGKRIVRRSR